MWTDLFRTPSLLDTEHQILCFCTCASMATNHTSRHSDTTEGCSIVRSPVPSQLHTAITFCVFVCLAPFCVPTVRHAHRNTMTLLCAHRPSRTPQYNDPWSRSTFLFSLALDNRLVTHAVAHGTFDTPHACYHAPEHHAHSTLCFTHCRPRHIRHATCMLPCTGAPCAQHPLFYALSPSAHSTRHMHVNNSDVTLRRIENFAPYYGTVYAVLPSYRRNYGKTGITVQTVMYGGKSYKVRWVNRSNFEARVKFHGVNLQLSIPLPRNIIY